MDRKDIDHTDDTVPPLLARSARKRVPGGVVEVKVKAAKKKKKPKVVVAPAPVGRPTRYCPEIVSKIINDMKIGYSLEAAAIGADIAPQILYKWAHKYPEFRDAIQTGRVSALRHWENLAMAAAAGEPGNGQLISLGLRNRARSASGWENEAKKIEITGANGGAIELAQRIDVSTLAPDDRDVLRDLLMRSAPRLIESTAVEMSDDGDDGEEEGDDVAVA